MGTTEEENTNSPSDGLNEDESPLRKERLIWGVVSAEEMKRPGAVLISLIFQAASARNLKPSDVCEALGISYSHFSSLRSGGKAIPHISEDFLERIAEFLQLPKVVVKLAAGQLKLEDFYHIGDKMHLYIEPALRFIQADPKIGATLPLSAFSADKDLQLFLITLYEQATGKVVLPGKVSVEDVVKRFEALTGDKTSASR
jgi:transcriptional regulator with XRE-family HTH domain